MKQYSFLTEMSDSALRLADKIRSKIVQDFISKGITPTRHQVDFALVQWLSKFASLRKNKAYEYMRDRMLKGIPGGTKRHLDLLGGAKDISDVARVLTNNL